MQDEREGCKERFTLSFPGASHSPPHHCSMVGALLRAATPSSSTLHGTLLQLLVAEQHMASAIKVCA